jgi:hypothetical protein
MALAEFVHELACRLGLRHNQGLVQQGPEAKPWRGHPRQSGGSNLLSRAGDVFQMEVPDNLLGAVLVHRQARVLVLDHLAEDVVEARIDRRRDDIVARHHDLAHH